MTSRNFARRSGLVVSLVVYGALGACSDGTAPLVPATIQVIAGDLQTGTAGAALTIAPSVKVLASNGKPVNNVPVTFAPAPESGTVAGGAQITDVNGVATVTSWTLGTRAGTSTLTVTVQGIAPVAITATTNPGTPTSFKVSEGDFQSGKVATALQVEPTVRLADAFDNPVPGVTISFALANGGSVERAQAVTDASGKATAGKWTLNTKIGTQQLTATANVTGATLSPITFSATASADVPSSIAIITQPATSNASGQQLTIQPVVELRDRFDNPAALTAAATVTASVASGAGSLSGTTSVVTQTGRVAFRDLSYTGVGNVQLRFTSGDLIAATSNTFSVAATPTCAGIAISLNYTLGQMARFTANSAAFPRCITFAAGANAGQQYLVMFENISTRGSATQGLFPGAPTDDGSFSFTIRASGTNAQNVAPPVANSVAAAPPEAVAGWMFGDKPVYEIQPKSLGRPALVKRSGQWISASGSEAAIVVGDTLQVYLEGLPRLNIADGTQRALVRYVDANIVIAEDLRFFTADTLTFRRQNGARNTPIADADLQQIASEYGRYALPQANVLFSGQYNAATTQNPGKPIAVHTMMYADGIWGYTYSIYNYFAFDYWINSTDGRTKTIYQDATREADDLFMHEIAHMRHWGVLERAGRNTDFLRGNTWLVEGFARFSERLPIAARLLNTPTPSRTGNVVLPYNPSLIWGGQQYFFYDDVPTYVAMGSNMLAGYAGSSFVFDYFADHVAAANGNWVQAIQDFLVAGGVQSDLDAVVNRYLGIDFGTLFSRARVALYADEYTPGLPASTQYLQYQLRASRYSRSGTPLVDPLSTWPKLQPGVGFTQTTSIITGGANGVLIDGTTATGDSYITIDPSTVPNGFMTIVRVK